MTPITSEDPQLKALPPDKVISYAKKAGWQQVSHPNQKLIVLQGLNDDLDRAIQIVLPQSHQPWDSSILLAKAINLLAEIERKAPEEILAAIKSERNSAKSERNSATGLMVQDLLQRRKKSPRPKK